MKTFVLGDVHGAYHALKQCLLRSGFDYHQDRLISLGDVCDGWPDTKQSIDELLKIKNLNFILGNHDLWTLEWMRSGISNTSWKKQGGDATMDSYQNGIPENHIAFLEAALPYLLAENNLFVHAGIDPLRPLKEQDLNIFLWDRALAQTALNLYTNQIVKKITGFKEVFIGHTAISYRHPIRGGEVWLMDTGAGWSGALSMMDVHTKEMFISDPVPLLYPGVKGRIKKD